jgi:hypothetical protein
MYAQASLNYLWIIQRPKTGQNDCNTAPGYVNTQTESIKRSGGRPIATMV